MKKSIIKRIACIVIPALFLVNCTFTVFSSSDDFAYPAPAGPSEEVWWDGGTEIIPPYKTVYFEGETLDLTGLEAYGISGVTYGDLPPIIKRRTALTDVTVDLADRPLTVDDTYVSVRGIDPGFMDMSVDGGFEITVLKTSESPIDEWDGGN